MSTDSTWADNLLVPTAGADVNQLQSSFAGLANFYMPSYSNMTALVATGQLTGRVAYLQAQLCQFCGSPKTNGKSVGVNLGELQAAQGIVTLVGTVLNGTEASINFVAPDSQSCPIDYSAADPNVMEQMTRVTDPATDRVRAVMLTGLSHNTTYYFRVNCATQQPTGKFRVN
jgi:phosphodiesterase/alkaline phosphatase D-like protein